MEAILPKYRFMLRKFSECLNTWLFVIFLCDVIKLRNIPYLARFKVSGNFLDFLKIALINLTALKKVDQINFIKVENNQFLLMSWQQINQCSSHLVSKRMWDFFCLLLRWCKATLSSIREKPTALADLFLQTSAFITFSIIVSLIDVKLIYI